MITTRGKRLQGTNVTAAATALTDFLIAQQITGGIAIPNSTLTTGLLKATVAAGNATISTAVAGTDYTVGGVTSIVEGAGIRVVTAIPVVTLYNRLFEGNSNAGAGQTIYGGTAAGEPLVLKGSFHASNGPINIPGPSGARALVIGGAANEAGRVSLALQSGNDAGSSSVQILFGYGGSNDYAQNIRTLHKAATGASNRIDFYTWTPADGAAIGSVLNMRMDNANVYVPGLAGARALTVGGATNEAGRISLSLRAGNDNGTSGSIQISLGYGGGDDYVQNIRSHHAGATTAGNGIDFYTWVPADGISTPGSLLNMKLDGGETYVLGLVAGGMVKADLTTGKLSIAVGGTDYVGAITEGAGIRISGTTTLTITNRLVEGLAGGQTVIGGTAASETLTLQSTVHATRGPVIVDASYLRMPNGTAAAPGLALTSSLTTGLYRYGSNILGIAASGVVVSRFTGTATARDIYLGENSTGITGAVSLLFESNDRGATIYLENATGNHLNITTPFRGANGSAGLPMWTFVNAATSGLYYYATDSIALSSNGVARQIFASNGLVTIPGPASDRALTVGGASNQAGRVSLSLQSGNDNGTTGSVQIAFGYANSNDYSHNIRTHHASATTTGNGFGFYTWRPSDTTAVMGSLLNLKIDGGDIYIPGLGAGGIVQADVTTGKLTIASSGIVTSVSEGAGIRVTGTTAVTVINRLFEGDGSGQTIYGGTTAGGFLSLQSTFHATKGPVITAGTAGASAFDIQAGNLELSGAAQTISKTGSGNLTIRTTTSGTAVDIQTESTLRLRLSATGGHFPDAGSFAAPSMSINESTVGLYRDASGVLGVAGRLLIGDAASGTDELLTLVGGSSGDKIYFGPGGGGYTVADGSGPYTQILINPQDVNVAKATVPTALNFFGMRLLQTTLVATGASGNAFLGTQAATLYIGGQPILSGNWGTSLDGYAVYVAGGIVRMIDTLYVGSGGGGDVFRATRGGGTPLIGVFGVTGVGQQTVTGSRGGNAALASALTAMAAFGWIVDSSSA